MRKAFTIVLMVILAVLPLMANGNSEKAVVEQAEPTSIKVWVSSGSEDGVYKKVFDNLEASLGITVVDEYYPKDELDQKLQVSPIVGDTPDLIVCDYLMVPSYYEAGLIKSIEDHISDSLKEDLIPSVVTETSYDGHTISIAQFDAGMGLWANKQMLIDAGVRIPTSYKDAWTKEEFEDALKKLKANGLEYPLYIRQNKAASLYFQYMPFIASFNGEYMNEDGTVTGAINGEGTLAAFEYLSWMVKEGYINGKCDYENGFYERKESALALLGHWKYSDHVNFLGDDAIIIPCPDMGNGVFTCSGSTVWAMTSAVDKNNSENLVWKVMEGALSEENIRIVTDFNGAIPSRKTVMDGVDNLKEDGRLYLYREQLEAGISVLRPLTPAHMTIYAEMQNAYKDVIGGADPKSVLDEAAKAIDEVILDNGWNR